MKFRILKTNKGYYAQVKRFIFWKRISQYVDITYNFLKFPLNSFEEAKELINKYKSNPQKNQNDKEKILEIFKIK